MWSFDVNKTTSMVRSGSQDHSRRYSGTFEVEVKLRRLLFIHTTCKCSREGGKWDSRISCSQSDSSLISLPGGFRERVFTPALLTLVFCCTCAAMLMCKSGTCASGSSPEHSA